MKEGRDGLCERLLQKKSNKIEFLVRPCGSIILLYKVKGNNSITFNVFRIDSFNGETCISCRIDKKKQNSSLTFGSQKLNIVMPVSFCK